MISATLQEAKAKLNQLVEAALAGEDVVLMRGAKVVARLMPLSEENLEITPQLTDTQAERFWGEIDGESSKSFRTAQAAVRHLQKK